MDENELTGAERYELAQSLIAEIMNCGTGDVDAIMDMMQTHDDLIDATREFIEDVDMSWSFGAFVSGIERLVLNEISGRIDDDLYDGLATVSIDDNYLAWGAVADSGDLQLEVAMVFAEMCRDGVTDERVEELIKEHEQAKGIGEYDDTK